MFEDLKAPIILGSFLQPLNSHKSFGSGNNKMRLIRNMIGEIEIWKDETGINIKSFIISSKF